MPFYEFIFETGSKSVAEFDDDETAKAAAVAHHERAIKGEPGRGASAARNDLGNEPQRHVADYPAERVVELLKYDVHPADLMADQTMSADVAKSELNDALKATTHDGVVNLMELAAAVREMANPLVTDPGRHDSMYKMKESETIPIRDESK